MVPVRSGGCYTAVDPTGGMTAGQAKFVEPIIVVASDDDQVADFHKFFDTFKNFRVAVDNISELDKPVFLVVKARSFKALFKGTAGAV
jgi:hypothetical protein